jgi:pyrimidine oxygenase
MDRDEIALEMGVFIPVGNGGWITSTKSPQTPSTYQFNRQVTVLAEKLGFDFVLSMAKWRGYGGPSQHWDQTLESLTTMCGLAEATTRIGVWGTVHTMIFHPAVVAKMAAVIDQISGGRFGLNLVAGSNPYDQGQMGLWRDLDHAGRYRLAEEWITVAKRLWTEERVNHAGEFYTLEDCVSAPKPRRMPPIICAGASDRGFRFTVENCSGGFFIGSDSDDFVNTGLRAKKMAAELNRPDFKTYALFMIIPGETDQDAQRRVDLYVEGADIVALNAQSFEYSADRSFKQNTSANMFVRQGSAASPFMSVPVRGAPRTIGRKLADLVRRAKLNGVIAVMPDFIDDLHIIGTDVVAALAGEGIITTACKMTQSEAAL